MASCRCAGSTCSAPIGHILITDNLEEDTPVAHDLLADWLPQLDSALLIYDQQAGYRQFLGADPHSAYDLSDLVLRSVDRAVFDASPWRRIVRSRSWCAACGNILAPRGSDARPRNEPRRRFQRTCWFMSTTASTPQMLDWVASAVADLVNEQGVPPGEIVVLAPFLSDALRFSLAHRAGEPRRARPLAPASRALRDEPATQCLLTLARLVHPAWGIHPGSLTWLTL